MGHASCNTAHFYCFTGQADARDIAEEAAELEDARAGVSVSIPTYLAFVPAIAGFGVFSAAAVPFAPRRTRQACIGTYSGAVGKERELLSSTEAYSFQGSLRHKPPKRRARSKQSLRQKTPYVLMHKPIRCLVTSRNPGPVFCVDGSDLRAGDGKFINHSCHHNVLVDPFYSASLSPHVSRGGSDSPALSGVIAMIYPVRYVLLLAAAPSPHSDISPHEQLSLTYEDTATESLLITEPIGGALKPKDCRCGAMFCCGDIIRRLAAGMLSVSDTHFLANLASQVNIMLCRLSKANKLWYQNTQLPETPSEEFILAFLHAHSLTQTPAPRMSLLYENYRTTMFGNSRLPYYVIRRTGLVFPKGDGPVSSDESENE